MSRKISNLYNPSEIIATVAILLLEQKQYLLLNLFFFFFCGWENYNESLSSRFIPKEKTP